MIFFELIGRLSAANVWISATERVEKSSTPRSVFENDIVRTSAGMLISALVCLPAAISARTGTI